MKDDEVVIDRGEGARRLGRAGREYIDATGGLWYCAVGHGRGEIADAAAVRCGELAAYDTFERLANRPALDLAERVAALSAASRTAPSSSPAAARTRSTPPPSWPAATGTRSGKPDKQRDRAPRAHAYHGMNAYGTSLAGIPANREGFGALIPDVAVGRHDDPTTLERLFEERGDQIAAVHRRAGDRRRRHLAPARRLLAAACRSCAAHTTCC